MVIALACTTIDAVCRQSLRNFLPKVGINDRRSVLGWSIVGYGVLDPTMRSASVDPSTPLSDHPSLRNRE